MSESRVVMKKIKLIIALTIGLLSPSFSYAYYGIGGCVITEKITFVNNFYYPGYPVVPQSVYHLEYDGIYEGYYATYALALGVAANISCLRYGQCYLPTNCIVSRL